MKKHIEREVDETFPAGFEEEHGFIDPEAVAQGKR